MKVTVYLGATLKSGVLPFPIQVGPQCVCPQVASDAAIRVHIWHLQTTATCLERSAGYTLGIYRHTGHLQMTVTYLERPSGLALGTYRHIDHLQTTVTYLEKPSGLRWASTDNNQQTVERPSSFLSGISGHNSCTLLRGLDWRRTKLSVGRETA